MNMTYNKMCHILYKNKYQYRTIVFLLSFFEEIMRLGRKMATKERDTIILPLVT